MKYTHIMQSSYDKTVGGKTFACIMSNF